VWSGDAYQSFLINRYLYEDDAITKRTLLALLGKPPYREHINTINDYSAYLILAVCEYIEQSGDLRFLRQVIDSVEALYQFICSRLSDEGYVVKRKGDWIFMDWHSFDKTDPFCPEQILLWKVHTAMAKLNQSLGESAEDCIRRAEKLKEKIEKDFWCEEKQAYIDSFASGQKKVTRHAAVFAILFDFVDTEKARLLGKSVLENETVAPITTPYFKLYELMALCRLGKIEPMQQYLTEYWGGMLSLGATSIWEAYDPTQSGEQHLSMYGKPFDRSLCHAWGSGPIYLLGRYCCGVEKNCNDFTVTPNHGIYTEFCAAVPVNGKTVTVEYKNGTYHIVTDAENGSVIQNGKAVPLIPNQPLEWTDSEKQ
ncbi:MAG TPA: alpha-rhamnosidase, partial [Ruminococcaceae bacterium]|nr:alpha-rhamnosidase [Oscillospiraceae bacterium]